ncbi:MAG: hypothetical protein GYB41_01615 [Oceanospirillales bacterium]|nr:hypothetical protein [Marinobacterium halophilum]MBR9827342.1 hypothetical protein [Oceanospirillales bacterium]
MASNARTPAGCSVPSQAPITLAPTEYPQPLARFDASNGKVIEDADVI